MILLNLLLLLLVFVVLSWIEYHGMPKCLTSAEVCSCGCNSRLVTGCCVIRF
ncbi:hypothetical protein GQ42DRAFT_161822 [Ramicandelaber brevisporus]|nr:hypothetical protein GQ42DRAFT_161822 [Ramicandelaber brevisporus]